MYEIFGEFIEQHEDIIYKRWMDYDKNVSSFSFFSEIEEEMLSSAKEQLSARIRKDTQVCLHIAGKSGDNRTLQKIFGPYSSFANRLLTFLLYRSGSVALSFETLKETVDRHGVTRANMLCRYDANPMVHLSSMFLDASGIEARLQEMKRDQKQVARRFWPLGVFPSC